MGEVIPFPLFRANPSPRFVKNIFDELDRELEELQRKTDELEAELDNALKELEELDAAIDEDYARL